MPTPNLDTAIRHEIDQFVSNLTTLVRQAALEAVKEALGATGPSVATPARRGPGRPRKNPAAPTASKPGRRTKRTSADVEAVANQVLAYVKANPGSRLEEIGRGMGVGTAGLRRPIQGLLAAGALRTEGQKRGTKYLPGGGAARSGAKVTRKKAGKRKAGKRGKKAAGRAKKK